MKQAIDGKYRILAINPCTGSVHDEYDSVRFSPADAAFVEMVQNYPRICQKLGADENQILGAEMMVERINAYAAENGVKVPDVVNDCEIDHCMNPTSE